MEDRRDYGCPPQFISHKFLSDLSSENCGVALENNAVMRAGALWAHEQAGIVRQSHSGVYIQRKVGRGTMH